MREVGRIQQGYFPTPDRVVQSIAKHLKLIPPPSDKKHKHVVIDPGCGTGKAIADIAQAWGNSNAHTYGIESDKQRAADASKLLTDSVWSAIEDIKLEGYCSCLFFNPPYDRIRNDGRMELELLRHVTPWVERTTGIMVLIVPDYVVEDYATGLAPEVSQNFDVLQRFRFPEPEYQLFKQAVLFCRRKEEKSSYGYDSYYPKWAKNPELWPVLPDAPEQTFDVYPVKVPHLKRERISMVIQEEATASSPVRFKLLQEAAAEDQPIERPLLPLRPGHLALCLAGGLCDGIVEGEGGERFLVKGTLTSRPAIHGKPKNIEDARGRVKGKIETYRTKHTMSVRCLRGDGTIETYTTQEAPAKVEDAVAVTTEEEGDDDE